MSRRSTQLRPQPHTTTAPSVNARKGTITKMYTDMCAASARRPASRGAGPRRGPGADRSARLVDTARHLGSDVDASADFFGTPFNRMAVTATLLASGYT